MMQIATVVVLSLLVFSGIPLIFWLARRPLIRELAAARGESRGLIAELTQALRDATDSRLEFERQTKKAVADELASARFEAQDWQRRAVEYRESIQGVLNERNAWNKMYDEQSIAHGNAQAVMMDAIGFLERKLKEAGSPVILPNIIRETQELYRERHVEPVLQRTGGATVARGLSQGQTMSDQEQK